MYFLKDFPNNVNVHCFTIHTPLQEKISDIFFAVLLEQAFFYNGARLTFFWRELRCVFRVVGQSVFPRFDLNCFFLLLLFSFGTFHQHVFWYIWNEKTGSVVCSTQQRNPCFPFQQVVDG